MAKSLTPKQEQFCRGILAGLNQSDAYRKAYHTKNMKPETVNSRAYDLMKHGQIAERIKALTKPLIEHLTMKRLEWLSICEKAARADIRKTVDDEDNPLPLKQLGENEAMALATYETSGIFAGKGKDRIEIGVNRTYRMADRMKALDLIGKAQAFYHDEEEGDVSKVPPRVEVVFVDAKGANVQVNVARPPARQKPKVEFVG